MKMLFVEDDPNKRDKISRFIHSTFPTVELVQMRSYNGGYNAVMTDKFDLVLLDMSLPMFDISENEDGYDVDPYAGRSLLTEMVRNKVEIPVIVVTQFDTFGEGNEFKSLTQLDAELRTEFPTVYRDSIFYSPAEENWKKKLEHALRAK